MAEQESGFAPTDPSDDEDLLAPEPKQDERASDHEATAESGAGGTQLEAKRTRPPGRQLVRLGWAALVVFAVIGLLMVVELARVSSAVNNNGCIQRAQAQLLQAVGPGVTPAFAGLDRLTAINQLKKCS